MSRMYLDYASLLEATRREFEKAYCTIFEGYGCVDAISSWDGECYLLDPIGKMFDIWKIAKDVHPECRQVIPVSRLDKMLTEAQDAEREPVQVIHMGVRSMALYWAVMQPETEQPKTFGCHHNMPTCANCESCVRAWLTKELGPVVMVPVNLVGKIV